jgi:hypothetical protein
MEKDIAELIKEREETYQEIKKKLLPLIIEFIKEAKKTDGHVKYFDLCIKMGTFSLTQYDLDRIVDELEKDGLIKNKIILIF